MQTRKLKLKEGKIQEKDKLLSTGRNADGIVRIIQVKTRKQHKNPEPFFKRK